MTTARRDGASKGQRQRKVQRGRERRRNDVPPESMIATIDRLLLDQVAITLNGQSREVSALEAIVFQLLQQGMSGNARASRVLLKYQELASRSADKRLHIRFLDNDDTQSRGNLPPENADG